MIARKNLLVWMFAALPLCFVPACAEKGGDHAHGAAKAEAFKRMTVDEVAAKIEEAKAGKVKLHVFDNNAKDRFSKSHVPTATWVEYDKIQASDLPADKDATLVFYCGSEQCSACHVGADAALKLGYKNVYIMPAGIKGWEAAKKPVETS
jgi:rhodanese-related sulfurtransferase